MPKRIDESFSRTIVEKTITGKPGVKINIDSLAVSSSGIVKLVPPAKQKSSPSDSANTKTGNNAEIKD